MNVLLSSCTHWWNAEAHYAAVLCEALHAAGHGAWILTQPGTRHAEELARRGLPIVTDVPAWETNPLRWAAVVKALRNLQTRLAVDVVDVFRSREFLPHALAVRESDVALVRTRGSAQPVRSHAINRWLYGKASGAVIASAEMLRRELIERLGLSAGHVRTIYYPAEPADSLGPAGNLATDPDARVRERVRFLAEQGWPPTSRLLCIVGRTFPEKGHEVLVDALARLVRNVPDAVLAIADKRYDDEAPHRARVQGHIADAGMETRVRWLGFRQDLRIVMACADAGVIPSLSSETNCRVAMEFFSVGTPVVAFPTGALPEVIENGVSGLVTPDHSPDALAAALERVLGADPLRAALSAGALRAARDRFSRASFLDQTLSAFEAARKRASVSAG